VIFRYLTIRGVVRALLRDSRRRDRCKINAHLEKDTLRGGTSFGTTLDEKPWGAANDLGVYWPNKNLSVQAIGELERRAHGKQTKRKTPWRYKPEQL
jgi:hypothetical protein